MSNGRLFRGFQVRGKVPVPRTSDRSDGRSKIQWDASYFDLLRIFDRDVYRVIRDTSVDLNWKIPSRSTRIYSALVRAGIES